MHLYDSLFGSHGVGGSLVLVVELLAVVVGDVLVEENDVLSVGLLDLAFVLSVLTSVDIDDGVDVALVEALVFSVPCDVETIEIVAVVLGFLVEAVSVDVITGFSEVLVRVVELIFLVFVLGVVSPEDARVEDVCFVKTPVVKVGDCVPDVDILLLLDVGWYVLVLPVVEVISFVEGDFVVVVKVDDDVLVEVPLLVEIALPEGVLIVAVVELVVVLLLFRSLVEVEVSFVSVIFLNVTGIKVV